jgi:hypothetical protein
MEIAGGCIRESLVQGHLSTAKIYTITPTYMLLFSGENLHLPSLAKAYRDNPSIDSLLCIYTLNTCMLGMYLESL